MISPNEGAGSVRRDDHALAIKPGEDAIQGHVGQSVKQLFKLERVRDVRHRKLRIDAKEFILQDQFGNKYFLYRAMLFDGELYDVAQWWWKGGSEGRLVGEFAKKFSRPDDAMMDYARDQAFLAFGRSNLALAKARRLSGAPTALEPKDLTHESNVLAKAIEMAGKPIQAEPFDAKLLLTPEKVSPKPSPNDEAKVVPFPTADPKSVILPPDAKAQP